VKLAEEDMEKSDLSKAIGIRSDAIGRYCKNEAQLVNLDHLIKICKYFNCELSDIMYYEKEKE